MTAEVGEVEVDVTADFSDFERRMKAMLAKMAAKARVSVQVTADTTRATFTMAAWRRLQAKLSVRQGRTMGRVLATAFVVALGKGLKLAGKAIGKAFSGMVAAGKAAGKELADAFKPVLEIFGKIASMGARKLAIGAIIAIIPLLTSAIGALTGSLLAFVAAAGQAVTVSFALPGILGAVKQAMVVGKIAADGFADAVKGDEEAMKKLAPSARESAKALKGLTPEWTALKKSVQGKVFEGLAPLFTKLGTTALPVLRAGLEDTAGIMNKLAKSTLTWVSSETFLKKFGTTLDGNNKIFDQLRQAALPFLKGMLNLYIALQPAALKLATKIKEVAKSFLGWSQGEDLGERLMGMFNRGWKAAGRLWAIVKNLSGVLKNVFGAAIGPGNGLLKTLVKLTDRFEAFTGKKSSQNAITEFVKSSLKATGLLFGTLGAIGKQLARLFDPRILIAFYELIERVKPTFERVFNAIVPLVQSVFNAILGFITPVFDKIGDAIEENGPKFEGYLNAIAGAWDAIAPLLSGIGSVIGEIISQSIDVLATIAGVIGSVVKFLTPAIAAISNFVGPLLSKFAPIIATVILAFTTWGSTLVRLVPIIGRFMAPVVKLVEYIFKKAAPIFSFIGKVVGVVFKGIGIVIGAVMKIVWGVISKTFGLIKKIIVGVLKVAWAIVKLVFKGIKFVVTTYLNAVWKVISTVFKFIWKIISSVMTWVWTKIKTVWTAIRDFIAPIVTKIKDVITGTWDKIKNSTSIVWNKIKDTMTTVLDKIKGAFILVVDKIGGIWDGLKELAAKPINFVIETVWNKGLVALADKLPGDNPLSTMSPIAFARGGKVNGPGTETSDSILARLSKNEFVVKASMAKRYAGLLERINAGTLPGFAKGGYVWPASGTTTQHTSGYPWAKWAGDINIPGDETGNPVRSYASGTVASALWNGEDGSYGNVIRINHGLMSTLYAHLSNIAVRAGQSVAAGQLIGAVGSTGNVTGPHLHFEIMGGSSAVVGADASGSGVGVIEVKGGIGGFIDKIKDVWASVGNVGNTAWGAMLAKPVASNLFEQMRDYFNDKIPGPGPIPSFATGGIAPGGMALVGERGPELVNLPRGSRVHTNSESKRMVGSGLPRKVTLRIGSRDFEAYVSELADDRIDAAESLVYQGA